MKKTKVVGLVVIIVSVLIVGYSAVNKVKTNIGDSTKFTEKELQAAVKEVKASADDYIEGSKIKKLTYDEAESNRLIVDYVPTVDSLKDYDPERLLILNSEIKAGSNPGPFEPKMTYEGFYWILVKKEKWQLVYSGFLT